MASAARAGSKGTSVSASSHWSKIWRALPRMHIAVSRTSSARIIPICWPTSRALAT